MTDLDPRTRIVPPSRADTAGETVRQPELEAAVPTGARVVLDTSVLIADPYCPLEQRDVHVVVPLTVIEELDGLKSRPDDVGRAARTALRTLEELRIKHGGSLAEPVPIGDGSATLQIEINNIRNHLRIEQGLDPAVPDNRIIGAAIGRGDLGPTTMVSNDAALRIKAAHLGVEARAHAPVRSFDQPTATGWSTVETDGSVVDDLYAHGSVDLDDCYSPEAARPAENEFAVLRAG
ncbi:MAG: PIN domain-containing protein, partial [Ilumatobacter sp.]